MSRAPAERGTEWGAIIFLRHEIYKNSVGSGEARMGMESQIMRIEKCTF